MKSESKNTFHYSNVIMLLPPRVGFRRSDIRYPTFVNDKTHKQVVSDCPLVANFNMI